jgi:hypothetical protein
MRSVKCFTSRKETWRWYPAEHVRCAGGLGVVQHSILPSGGIRPCIFALLASQSWHGQSDSVPISESVFE